jgi:hypothetical protein
VGPGCEFRRRPVLAVRRDRSSEACQVVCRWGRNALARPGWAGWSRLPRAQRRGPRTTGQSSTSGAIPERSRQDRPSHAFRPFAAIDPQKRAKPTAHSFRGVREPPHAAVPAWIMLMTAWLVPW